MRISETLLIKLDDVDFARKTIFLPAENTKGVKDRVVFFSIETSKTAIETAYIFFVQTKVIL